jgi:hypothetical protein
MIEGLSAAARQVFLGTVEPEPFQRLAFEQRPDGMHSGPVPRLVHEIFLNAVRQAVAQSLDLSSLLGADYDRLVASAEDLLLPAGQASDLPGQLGEEVAHESGELSGILGPEQEVHVVGDADQEADPDLVTALGPGEGPDEDLVELGTGAEQGTAMERPAGDLGQGSFLWDEAESSAHAQIRRKIGPETSSP